MFSRQTMRTMVGVSIADNKHAAIIANKIFNCPFEHDWDGMWRKEKQKNQSQS